MGTDKALLPLSGRALASYPLAALRAAGATEVLGVGGDGPALTALGFRFVPDPPGWQGEGPLAGIVRALEVATEALVVVVACDMPAVDGAAITALLRAATDASGSVAVGAGRRQPLLAAYPRAFAKPLAVALAAGERAVHRAIAAAGLVFAEVRFDDDRIVRNVNTPADLEEAAEWIGALRRRSTWPAGGGR